MNGIDTIGNIVSEAGIRALIMVRSLFLLFAAAAAVVLLLLTFGTGTSDSQFVCAQRIDVNMCATCAAEVAQ